jgi:hypothetical protein
MKKIGLLLSAIMLLAGMANAQTTIFSDNMTGFPTGWTLSPTTGGWTKTSTKYYSSSYSAMCDEVSPYGNSQNNYMTKTVSLSSYTNVTLKFYIWQYSESGYDYIRVQYYSGSTWTTAWQRAGSYQTWAQQSVSIPNTATQIRFYFSSDASVTNTGVFIDDVTLTGTATTVTQNDAGSGTDAGNTFTAALSVVPGTYTCYLDATDRDDYFKFNVTSGQQIKVKVVPPSTADYDLYLYDPTQAQKASSTLGTGIADSVVFTATATGYWYARAYEYSGSGNYTLIITVTGGTSDTQAPTVSITAPTGGATVSGTTTVTASASDNVGVSKVEFYIDGTLKSTDTSSPYSYDWNTTTYTNSSHSIYAKAYDAANNVGTSSTVTVTVSNSVSTTAEWTIMVYLNADNNLETDGINDFLEMAAASYSSGKINVIVQMDRSSSYDTQYDNWTTCKRFKVASGMTPTAANQISDLGEVDMGSPTTLVNFATWAIQNYPANRYSLVMWDHGDGWYKKDGENEVLKGFSNDDSHGSVIGIANGEFAGAMAQIKTALGRNLDHIGWDACLMGMWEVLDISRNYANVANVSEETEGSAGWYYTTWLNTLNTTPTTTAIDLGKAIINGTSNQSTLSVVDLTQIPALTTKINAFADSLMVARGAGYSSAISTALTNCLKFSTSYFTYHIDLSDFARQCSISVARTGTRNAAHDVIVAVGNAVKLYKNSTTYANARGIAVYHCKIDGSNYDATYNNLPIASSTVWDEYIKGGSTGGTTSPNYTKSTATYSWDASATTASGCTGDDQAVTVNIGFTFNYYGTNYTAVNICSNGFINFGTTSTSYSPTAIPNTAAPNALIAGIWRDLNPSGGGTITYYSSSTKCVISFNAVKNYANTSTQTFQMILTPDGKIKIQWGSITTTETYVSGVENQTGTLGVSTTAAANSAVLFTPPSAWSSPIAENEETRLNFKELQTSNLLFQNAPNPVRHKTLIAYQLEKSAHVSLKIYNLNGQLVRTLVDGDRKSGYFQAMWDARDNFGKAVAEGIYIYKLIADNFEQTRKMVLVR